MIETPNRKGKEMARNGRPINVKIATTKVVKALETKLAQLRKDKENQKSNEAKYKKAVEKWSKETLKLALASISKADDVNINTNYRNEISVHFNLPAGSIEYTEKPEPDYETLNDWDYKGQVEEIENAIRILKMTDEEVVSTSTYNAIARYL